MEEDDEYSFLESFKYHFYTHQSIIHGAGALMIGSVFLLKGSEAKYIWDINEDAISVVLIAMGMALLVLGIILGVFACSRFTFLVFEDNFGSMVIITILYLILFSLELAFAIIFLTSLKTEKEALAKRLEGDFGNQAIMGNPRMNDFHILQDMLRCCGIVDFNDYGPTSRFPMSCCSPDINCERGINNYPGCKDIATNELEFLLIFTGSVYIVMALLDLVAIAFIVMVLVTMSGEEEP